MKVRVEFTQFIDILRIVQIVQLIQFEKLVHIQREPITPYNVECDGHVHSNYLSLALFIS